MAAPRCHQCLCLVPLVHAPAVVTAVQSHQSLLARRTCSMGTSPLFAMHQFGTQVAHRLDPATCMLCYRYVWFPGCSTDAPLPQPVEAHHQPAGTTTDAQLAAANIEALFRPGGQRKGGSSSWQTARRRGRQRNRGKQLPQREHGGEEAVPRGFTLRHVVPYLDPSAPVPAAATSFTPPQAPVTSAALGLLPRRGSAMSVLSGVDATIDEQMQHLDDDDTPSRLSTRSRPRSNDISFASSIAKPVVLASASPGATKAAALARSASRRSMGSHSHRDDLAFANAAPDPYASLAEWYPLHTRVWLAVHEALPSTTPAAPRPGGLSPHGATERNRKVAVVFYSAEVVRRHVGKARRHRSVMAGFTPTTPMTSTSAAASADLGVGSTFAMQVKPSNSAVVVTLQLQVLEVIRETPASAWRLVESADAAAHRAAAQAARAAADKRGHLRANDDDPSFADTAAVAAGVTPAGDLL